MKQSPSVLSLAFALLVCSVLTGCYIYVMKQFSSESFFLYDVLFQPPILIAFVAFDGFLVYCLRLRIKEDRKIAAESTYAPGPRPLAFTVKGPGGSIGILLMEPPPPLPSDEELR